MRVAARQALKIIRDCVDSDRFVLLPHFVQRMEQRGLFLPDVLAVLEVPSGVRYGGLDKWERPKWLIRGTTADALALEIVCVLDRDDRGQTTVFITIY
jgi:hypothetical protein